MTSFPMNKETVFAGVASPNPGQVPTITGLEFYLLGFHTIDHASES